MVIRIYAITKNKNDDIKYIKLIEKFGVFIKVSNIFNKKINASQKISPKAAKSAYGIEFLKYLDSNARNIALHPSGKELDTYEFAKLIQDSNTNFFIGGAFGFNEDFLNKVESISLSKLTLNHDIAKIVLCEQIYRSLCIIYNYPYHK